MGGEEYYVWCEMMEMRQHKNDLQMQYLLYQTKWLKQENDELQT